LVEAGNQVEWFTASFAGSPKEEVVDGVRILRKGRQWTVHFHAFRHYRSRLHDCFDAVIDEINTIPFFTPLWARIPAFAMIWQLAREVWWYESRFPLSAIGYLLEPIYLRAYQRSRAFTFSKSTAADLRNLGFKGMITLVPPGIAPIGAQSTPKDQEPSFIYVGRLAPSKRIDDIVEAFALFRHARGHGRLILVGNGRDAYVGQLVKQASRLGISDAVEYTGWLEGTAKHRRMAQAHVLLMTSAREGWGLVVTECNSCGTPAVVYDVPGLRDSVRHMETGLVVRPTPQSLANGMLQITGDSGLYERLRHEAQTWSRTFTYEAGARVVLNALSASVAP
jgi:glycosyltransferase involved in cell wall biosynthesis